MKNVSLPELEPDRMELRDVDIGENEAVRTAVAQNDVVVNCAVVRERRGLAFRVNVCGTYFAVRAAAAAGHRRFINTGPSGTVVGPSYRAFTGINEQVPPWPGTGLYYITKGLGHEITRVFAQNTSLHVLTCLFGGVSTPPEPKLQGQPGPCGSSSASSWPSTPYSKPSKAKYHSYRSLHNVFEQERLHQTEIPSALERLRITYGTLGKRSSTWGPKIHETTRPTKVISD